MPACVRVGQAARDREQERVLAGGGLQEDEGRGDRLAHNCQEVTDS